MSEPEVLIVGGGIAGLCCARHLFKSGVQCKIVEAGGQVGGRARTEEFDGFRLDRGFQVLLTAYPEAKQVLDYDKLQLKYFEPGALIRYKSAFHRFVDPWRRPRHFLKTAFSPIATLADKLRVARLRSRVCRGSLDQLNAKPEATTLAKLREEGFSERIIEHFFRPFLGGVFLENELTTSSRKFEFVFRMFSQGDAAMPAGGMGAIAMQLAEEFPANTILTNTPAVEVGPNHVLLQDGQVLRAEKTVIACEAPAAAKLLGSKQPTAAHAVTCIYFSADTPPVKEPILVLNGEGHGPINNLSVPSLLDPSCAPTGKSLVSVTVLGSFKSNSETELLESVHNQLRDWYGSNVDSWNHLKTFKIPYALPVQNPGGQSQASSSVTNDHGIVLCGDYMENASIQGAMVSGRFAAEAILNSHVKR